MIQRVRGTEDLLDLTLQNFVVEKIKEHLECHNLKEIQTPILEHTNLFVRTLGEETDVVTKEMYVFQSSGGESICLRPEATAPTMRAFLDVRPSTPWKIFSIGPMFRHERPQKGRWRQFSQANMEIIGTTSIADDALFIKMIDSLFSEVFKLENYVLKLNFLGEAEERKKHKEKLYEFLESKVGQICDTCNVRKEKNILRIFDCKNKQCSKLYKDAPTVVEHLGTKSQEEWQKLQELLALSSVSFVFDPTLVRGLDYYSKSVFEFVSPDLGAQSSFCGGGRYDSLANMLGSKDDYPSIGAAIGLGRLQLLLEKVKDRLTIPTMQQINVVIPLCEKQYSLALLLAQELQSSGLCLDVIFETTSMKSKMRKANKMGAKFALILGDDEQKTNSVTIKNMQSGEEQVIKQTEAANHLKGR